MFKFRQNTHPSGASRPVSGQIGRVKTAATLFATGNKPGQPAGTTLGVKSPGPLFRRF